MEFIYLLLRVRSWLMVLHLVAGTEEVLVKPDSLLLLPGKNLMSC